MDDLNDILSYSDAERRKLRLKNRRSRRKPYSGVKRPRRSREELIEYLKDKKITSSRNLLAVRSGDEPNVYDYIKAFDYWQNAMDAAFGKRIIQDNDEIDAEYLVKCVIEFNLWTLDDFNKAHKLRPDIVPSNYYIGKRWGRWSNLSEYARHSSFKRALDACLELKKRLGRMPSLKDYERENIKLDAVMDFFGGKRQMDGFLVTMGGTNEGK